MQDQITQLSEKSKAATKLEKKIENLKKLQKAAPKGFATSMEVIRAVIGLAQANGVNVLFYAPKTEQTEKYYTTQKVDFTFQSSYLQMLTITRLIEQSTENLKIDSWKKEAESPYEYAIDKSAKDTAAKNLIKWKVSISSTTLINEK